MHPQRASLTAAIGFSLLSLSAMATSAMAADLPADQLLKQAQAEQPYYLATVRQLVDVDTGTGQAPGLKVISALLVGHDHACRAVCRRQYRRHVQRQWYAILPADGPLRHRLRPRYRRKASVQARQRTRLRPRCRRRQRRGSDDSAFAETAAGSEVQSVRHAYGVVQSG